MSGPANVVNRQGKWTICPKANINNLKTVWLTYEELCDTPGKAKKKIIEFMPEIKSLNFNQRLTLPSIRGRYTSKLHNFNKEQIKRLSKKDIDEINSFLSPRKDLLDFFGYELL